jgi:hypothetical protein
MNNKQRIVVNHIGKKYGKLLVLEFSHSVTYQSGSSKKFWKCGCDCGNEAVIDTSGLTSGRTKSCGCHRKKNGKKNKQGYNLIYSRSDKKYVMEHRYVYEKHYGIILTPNQNIHHINGDRLDNRIENLELWDTSQPSGQRVEDKIVFYKQLVELYKTHPLYSHMFND